MNILLAYLTYFLVLIVVTSSMVSSSVDSIHTNSALVDIKSSINSDGHLTTVSNGGSVSFVDLTKDQSLVSVSKQAQPRIRRRANLISSSSRLDHVADPVQSSAHVKVRNRSLKLKTERKNSKANKTRLVSKPVRPDFDQDSDDPSSVPFIPPTEGYYWGKVARMLLTKRYFKQIFKALKQALNVARHQLGFWGPDSYGQLPSTGSTRQMWIKFHIKENEYDKTWYCTVHFTNVKRMTLGVYGERLERLKCTDKMLLRIIGQLKNGQFTAKVDKTSKVLSNLGIHKTKDSKKQWL